MNNTYLSMKSSLGSLHAALSTFVRWCLLPGIVVHELSHAAACQLLGVEITGIKFFERSESVTSPKLRAGFVSFEKIDSGWQSALISIAPLLGNTLVALGAFTIVRRVLQEGTFSTLGIDQQVVIGVGLWCGITIAVTGFPSEPDLRGFGRQIGFELSSKYPSILLGQMQPFFAVVYALSLTLCSLFGVQGGLHLLVTEYIGFPIAVLLVGVWNVIRLNNDQLPLPLTAVERRVSRLSSQIDSGTPLVDEDIEYLVDKLTNTAPIVREQSATALVTVAARQPEQIAPYTDELLTVAETGRDPVVRQALLTTLSNARDWVENYDRLATVGVSRLDANATPVRDAAPRLLLGVALDEPAVLDESVPAMQSAVPHISPAERGDLVLALTLVETGGVAPSTEPGTSQIAGVDTDSGSIAKKEQLLRSLPADARELAAILAESLESTPKARPRTVTGLRKLGETYPAAQPAITALLIAYLHEPDPETRANVGMALRSFAEGSPAIVGPHRAALETVMSDPDPRVRRDVAAIIGLLAEGYPDVIETYTDECCALLDGNEGEIRKTAAWALAMFAETSPSTLESRTDQLVAQLIDPKDDVRAFSMQTLAAIAEVSPECVAPHVDVLQHHVTDPAADVPMWVSIIFTRLVDSHPTAIAQARDRLIEVLNTEDGVVRHNALTVLGKLSQAESSSVEAGIDVLINRLEDGDEDQRMAAARALAALVPYAPTLLEWRHPRLISALDDAVPHVQPTMLETISASVPEDHC